MFYAYEIKLRNMANKYQKYIGDGVYVSFDGYHINIAVNHHENHTVALEPEVVNNLKKYFKEIEELRNSKSE